MMTGLLAISIANIGGGSGPGYKAVFSNATSLNEGDDVRIGGVKVGQVTGVDVMDHNMAEVSFTVNRDGGLPADTVVALKYRNLVGQRYVAVEQGNDPSAPKLKKGATIPVDQTRPALNLTELFNGFRPLFQTLQPDDVNKLAYSIIQVFQGEGDTVADLVASTSSLANTVADKDAVIGNVIDNLNDILDTVNEHAGELDQMVVNTRNLVEGLAADRDAIGSSISSLADLTDATTDLLEPTRPSIQGLISGTNQLASGLNAQEGDVDKVLQTLPKKYEALNRTAMYGSWFQFYLCGLDLVIGKGHSDTLNIPDLPMPTANLALY
ncbi:MAG: MCE family protein, partial [Tomitella sp.]|nr:MCE family protein [Tomitella sp.]